MLEEFEQRAGRSSCARGRAHGGARPHREIAISRSECAGAPRAPRRAVRCDLVTDVRRPLRRRRLALPRSCMSAAKRTRAEYSGAPLPQAASKRARRCRSPDASVPAAVLPEPVELRKHDRECMRRAPTPGIHLRGVARSARSVSPRRARARARSLPASDHALHQAIVSGATAEAAVGIARRKARHAQSHRVLDEGLRHVTQQPRSRSRGRVGVDQPAVLSRRSR